MIQTGKIRRDKVRNKIAKSRGLLTSDNAHTNIHGIWYTFLVAFHQVAWS